jgi:alpha/beta hydrolase family protein
MFRNQVRLELTHCEPFAGGISFGDTGPYERLLGKAHFAIDPHEPGLPFVCDLDLAPCNPEGLVEFSATLDIVKPVDLSKGNRRALYEFSNRGRRAAITGLNYGAGNDMRSPKYAGDGFLMRLGYTVIWSGWQGDLIDRGENVLADVPFARGKNGEHLRGSVRQEFSAIAPGVLSMGLSAGAEGGENVQPYPVVDPETATLTLREREADPRVPLDRPEWQFATADMTPSNEDLYIKGGFKPGWIYELIYETEGSRLVGLGFLGVRDVLSMLRYAQTDSSGAPNPLAGSIDKMYATGVSLSGRVIREYVYEGWNQDAQGRQIFEGVHTHTGSGRLLHNIRFSQVGRYPRQHEEHQWPSEYYPFTFDAIPDPFSDKVDGLWKRPATDPLVIHTHTEGDYWNRHVSLTHTDCRDGSDLELPANTRIYHMTGAPHMARPVHDPIWIGQLTPNDMSATAYRRAAMVLLDRWATDGTPPPMSRVPRRSDGTMVSAAEALARYPRIPGVALPKDTSRLPRYDYGPEFDSRGIISEFPPQPVAGQEYPLGVPQIDEDGNTIAGVRFPDVDVPLGTYNGWSLRKAGFAEGEQFWNTGSFVPFARTRAERLSTGDPRPSIEERYGSDAEYVEAVRRAAAARVAEGLLLQEDADLMVKAARERNPLDPATRLGPLIFVLVGPGG